MSEKRGKGAKSDHPDLKALYISVILTAINALKDEGAEGRERLQQKRCDASPWRTQVCFCEMRLCPKSHPCPGKHLLVAVTQLCIISACPAHGGYPLKNKSAARLWSSTFRVNIWRSNIWPDRAAWCAPIYFCYKGFSAGDKSR